MIHHPTIAVCKALLFPLIQEQMAIAEPAPEYEHEPHGIDRLESVLQLMDSGHYADELAQASYLFCAIIDGHPFSNGNKRLAVTLLSYFLLINGNRFHVSNIAIIREELRRKFPHLEWQKVHSFKNWHQYFLYHLALIIADRAQKGRMTFQDEQKAVRELLVFVVSKKAT